MAEHCEYGECKSKVDNTHEVVFLKSAGIDGGLQKRMTCVEQKKIGWTHLKWLVPVLISVIGGLSLAFGGLAWRAIASDQKTQDTTIETVKDEQRKARREHKDLAGDVKKLDQVQQQVITQIPQMKRDIDEINGKLDSITEAVIRIETKLEQ